MRAALPGAAVISATASLWLLGTLMTAGAMLATSGPIYDALELSPMLRAIVTLSVAMAVATVAASIAWQRLRVHRRRPHPSEIASGAAQGTARPITITRSATSR